MEAQALRAGQGEGDGQAFGSTLARYLGQTVAPTSLTYTADRQPLAVTRVKTTDGRVCETQPVPPEDAFHVVLQCRDLPSHELWINGRQIHTGFYPQHSTSVIDLRTGSRTRIASAHEALVFYVPRAALNEIASDFGSPAIDRLRPHPGIPTIDPVMARLGRFLLPTLDHDDKLDQLQVDQLMLTMQAYLAQAYGGLRPVRLGNDGALTSRQERLAKEVMGASVGRPLSLAEIAQECSLSVSHFARGFRQATGMPPHRWLIERRMEAAQTMLLAGDLPIAEVAQACGFADQSSFTKAFVREVGASPAIWRRALRS